MTIIRAGAHDVAGACLGPDAPVRRAIELLDRHPLHIVLVVDAAGRLLGTITDADVRKAMLRGLCTDSPARALMNPEPSVTTVDVSPLAQQRRLQASAHHHLPVLDGQRRLVGLLAYCPQSGARNTDNWVVVMAGGAGMRLRPLTEHTPKPLLHVGNRPLLEQILESFIDQGFGRFFFAVHYKAEMVQRHFGDGSRFGVSIEYLREEQRRGTAGALSLLPPGCEHPLIVMNGDLLTRLDFRELLSFHASAQAPATMCVREHEECIPYGVVQCDGLRLRGIVEKPSRKVFVNAGIYVLGPGALSRIPPRGSYDMPQLFEGLVDERPAPALFPVREYWLDIGRMDDYERANAEFATAFPKRALLLA